MEALKPALDNLNLEPGRVLGLEGPPGSGLTRLALSLLADPARAAWVACVDVRGWLSPAAAWDAGVEAERLAIVRCDKQRLWPQVTAALLEGMGAVYAEVPNGVPTQMLRRLGALARARGAALILRPLVGTVPAGVAHLRLEAREVAWEGAESGFGRLRTRTLSLLATGKGAVGVPHLMEMEDDGEDAVRLVSRLAVALPGRAAG
jgi:hypothetical protein